MNKIGVRLHDLGKSTPYELVHKAKVIGFQGGQLVFKKALKFDNAFDNIELISDAFSRFEIPLLGAYFNPVHPVILKKEDGINNFKEHLKIAKELNAEYVGTETGSKMGSPWGYVKKNHSKASFDEVVDVVSDLAKTAEEYDSYIAIEGAYAHVIHNPEVLRNLLDMVKSPRVKVIVDLYNYLNAKNYKKQNQIFDDCISYLKDDIVIYHLKDFVVKAGILIQVGLGKGIMDFDYILNRIQEETPNAYLIFEGIKEKDMLSSFQFISSKIHSK